jgi:hypothetical protein
MTWTVDRSSAPQDDAFDAADEGHEVDAAATGGGCLSFAQLQHQLAHLLDRVLDGRHHVLLELWIGMQAFRIAQHEAQLGDDVLEIVDDERRHPVERVELARLEQRFRRDHLGQEASGLAARRLQQVGDLSVDVDRRSCRAQRDESEEFVPDDQRYCQPVLLGSGQPLRQDESGIVLGPGAKLVEVDDPARSKEKLGQ